MIKKWKAWLNRQLGHSKQKKRKYMLIIAAVGLLFIIISNLFSGPKQEMEYAEDPEEMSEEEPIEEVSLTDNVKDVEEQYESDLESMLNQINGVSEAEVMINVDATNEQVYEKDVTKSSQTTDESDKNGGRRDVIDETNEKKLVHIRKGDEEVPVLIQTKKPAVRGVFVIAQGAEEAKVKKWIIESVSRVLDVPAYKISVMPK